MNFSGELPACQNRRTWLQSCGVGLLAAGLSKATLLADSQHESTPVDITWRQEMNQPVLLDRLDVVRLQGKTFIRARSQNGQYGIVPDNGRYRDLESIWRHRVRLFFLNRDLRLLPRLVDEIYIANSNYKWAGLPFWNAVAFAELACLDLLAQQQDCPVGALLGKIQRTEIPVYLTRLTRDTTAEQELIIVQKQLAVTGAQACKLKIGGRMKNEPADEKRTQLLIANARKALGDDCQINVDANGSYSASDAIRIGQQLQQIGCGFFEEPCPWEDYEQTATVAAILKMPVAAGEQDSSWTRWQQMLNERMVDLAQPDLYYNGGLIRTIRLARLAASNGIKVTPHSPKTGLPALPMLQFAAITPNLGPFQEYAFSNEIKGGKVVVPDRPGLGHSFTQQQIEQAELIDAQS